MSNSTERIGNGTVSIIIPVYNAEMVLSRCLDSVLRQTYHSIEILAIDDGSTDSSGAILDEYARSDLRIKVIHTENHGVGTARNIGLDEASGDYISFVDADDVVNPHYIERLVNVLLETNTDVSTCCAIDLPDDELREIKDNWNVNEEKPIILAINPSCTAEQFFDYTQPTAHTVVWGGYMTGMFCGEFDSLLIYLSARILFSLQVCLRRLEGFHMLSSPYIAMFNTANQQHMAH